MVNSNDAAKLLGANSINFLSDDDYTFASGTGTWSATNASFTSERNRQIRDKYATLRIQPLSTGSPYTEVEITHQQVLVPSAFVGDKMVGTVFVYPYAPMLAAVRINSTVPSNTSVNYINCPALKWTLIRSEELDVPSELLNQQYRMTVLFKSSGGFQHFHMGHPVLTNSYGFTQNRFLRETMMFMPLVLTEIDSQQVGPQFPMYRFMDVGLAYADPGYRQSINFKYRDISQGFKETDDSTKSTLVDPDVVESKYIPWLGQFVGVRLPQLAGVGTAWGNLPNTWEGMMEDIDPVADITYDISSVTRDGAGVVTATLTASPTGVSIGDTVSVRNTSQLNGQFVLTDVNTGTNTVEWAQAGSSVTETIGSITLVDTSWGEIEQFNTTDTEFIERRRGIIAGARVGHNSGTYGALEESAKVLLSGTKSVEISIEPVAFPWTIFVKTLTSETPSGITGEPAPLVVAELNNSRPMGFVIVHECVDSL